uniref:Uncharacterized protein n=1 Tax=Parastrongyloides trichosuri TaxID=131310 RepID=A0A0N4ZJZ2_PARTI
MIFAVTSANLYESNLGNDNAVVQNNLGGVSDSGHGEKYSLGNIILNSLSSFFGASKSKVTKKEHKKEKTPLPKDSEEYPDDSEDE